MGEWVGESRELWAECLPEESVGFMDYYYGVKAKTNWIQTDVEDGELVSMVHWNPYRMFVRGEIWDSRYVIAVATKKEYRRQGRMARLLMEGMRKYAAEGMPFVWLMPIALGIYEPFDFRFVYEKFEGEWTENEAAFRLSEKVICESSIGHSRELACDEGLCIRPLREEEYGVAAGFLNRELAARYEVFTQRSEEWLQVVAAEVASENGRIWGIFDEDGLAGVFHEWRGETVEIRELVCRAQYEAGVEAQRLIRGIREALEADMGITGKGTARITAVTTGWLGAPKSMIMARIINVKEFITVIRAEKPRTIRLQIIDSLIPDNDGIFLWHLTEYGSQIERICQNGECEEPELKIGISDLTEWLFGHIEMPGYEDICPLNGVFLNEIV